MSSLKPWLIKYRYYKHKSLNLLIKCTYNVKQKEIPIEDKRQIIGTANWTRPFCQNRGECIIAWESSVCSFKRVRADVGSVLQDLPGDLLDVGIVVLRRVWNGLRWELQNKPLSLVKYKSQHSHLSGSCHRITLDYIQAIKKTRTV